jgi:hypothetical protein
MTKKTISAFAVATLFLGGLAFFIGSNALKTEAKEAVLTDVGSKPAACKALIKDGSCGCTANGGTCNCGKTGSNCAANVNQKATCGCGAK